MDDTTMFLLVQWEDRLVSVISAKDVVHPTTDHNKMNEGQYIRAVWQRKTYNAVISEIHPNKKYLKSKEKMPLMHPYQTTAGDSVTVQMQQSKTDEAKEVKKMESQKKREQLKEREAVNMERSDEILQSMNKTDSQALDAVHNLMKEVQDIKDNQAKMMAKLDLLTEIANCSKCLRAKYKITQKYCDMQPRPHRFVPSISQATIPSSPTVQHKFVPSISQATIPSSPTVQQSPEDQSSSLVPVQVETMEIDTPSLDDAVDKERPVECQNGLVFFGEAKFNVLVDEQELQRVRACSKNNVKFALNALSILVSPDECRDNMTVYGEGKNKQAMDLNKRKALRSEILNRMTDKTKEEKETFWMETIVPKLNNKIRGIRNDKYKML